MKANKYILADVGGAFPISTKRTAIAPAAPAAHNQGNPDSDDFDNLYALPIEPPPVRRHDAHSLRQRLKAKRLAEARLIHLSAELSKLADEIRYLNPLMAETLDEAWEATEDAIEMLSNQHLW